MEIARWWMYVERLIDGDTYKEAARLTRSPTERDMLRWLKDSAVRAETASAQLEDIAEELQGRFPDDLADRRSSASPSNVRHIDDDEIAAAVREANELRGAAQKRTPRLDEPDSP